MTDKPIQTTHPITRARILRFLVYSGVAVYGALALGILGLVFVTEMRGTPTSWASHILVALVSAPAGWIGAMYSFYFGAADDKQELEGKK